MWSSQWWLQAGLEDHAAASIQSSWCLECGCGHFVVSATVVDLNLHLYECPGKLALSPLFSQMDFMGFVGLMMHDACRSSSNLLGFPPPSVTPFVKTTKFVREWFRWKTKCHQLAKENPRFHRWLRPCQKFALVVEISWFHKPNHLSFVQVFF